MLDERVSELFRDRIALRVKQRRPEFLAQLSTVKGGFAARNISRSSIAGHGIREVYEREFVDLCREAWDTLQSILGEVGVEPSETLATELRQLFADVVSPAQAEEEFLADKSVPATLNFQMSAALGMKESLQVAWEVIENEIEVFVEGLKNRREKENVGRSETRQHRQSDRRWAKASVVIAALAILVAIIVAFVAA